MSIYNIFRIKIQIVAILILFCNYSNAQMGFESPHDCIFNHLYYLQADTYQPNQSAKSLFPLKDSILSQERAIELKQILDAKGLFVYMSKIPITKNYIDSSTEKNIYILFPAELPQVYVEKYKGKWVYSSETVNGISQLHKDTYPWGTDKLIKYFPSNGGMKFLGITAWQFFGFCILLFSIVIIHFLLSKILFPIFKKLGRLLFHRKKFDNGLLHSMSKYLSLIIVFYILRVLLPILQLPVKLMEYTVMSIRIVTIIIGAILFFKIIDWILKYLDDLTQQTESKMDDQLMPIVSKMLKILIVILTLFRVLAIFDVNVTALIAGLSIGGLALALAAQDTVKNLIGSVMIFIDQPFQIGDYIQVGNTAGTVHEVGFRSTRIIAKDSSIISIPNSTMSNASVTNKGVRVFRLFETTLGLTYDTPPAIIEEFILGLKDIIMEHPKAHNENHYVHFVKMDASSLNILFRLQLAVADYYEELEVGQELHLSILRLAEKVGVNFAFPSTSIYIESIPKK